MLQRIHTEGAVGLGEEGEDWAEEATRVMLEAANSVALADHRK